MPHAKYNCLVGAASNDENPKEVILNLDLKCVNAMDSWSFICINLNCRVLLILVEYNYCLATTDFQKKTFKAFDYLSIC